MPRGLREIDWLAPNDAWVPTHVLAVEVFKHGPGPGAPKGIKQKVLESFDSYEEARAAAVALVRAAVTFDPLFRTKVSPRPEGYSVQVSLRRLTDGRPAGLVQHVVIMSVPSRPKSSWQIIEGEPEVTGMDPARMQALLSRHALVEAYFAEKED